MKIWNKFKSWMRYNPPAAADADYWVSFDEEFKENAPVRYFFTKGKFRTVWWKVKHFFENIIDWFRYRTVARYHVVDSGLPPNYWDVPELMLYTNFNLLVRYVEDECSALGIWGSENKQERKNLLGWRRHFPYFIRRHLGKDKEFAKKYGLEHLDWEISLDAEYDQHQAEVAKEVKTLYLWWTEERPNRKELESPVMDMIADPDTHMFKLFSSKWREENPVLHQQWQEYCEQAGKLDEEWRKEDEEMLIRLMKIRLCLWT